MKIGILLPIKFSMVIVVLLGLFWGITSSAKAQTCTGGGVECGTSLGTVCNIPGCDRNNDPNCHCQDNVCQGGVYHGCSLSMPGACQGDVCSAAGRPCTIGGSCNYAPGCPSGMNFCGDTCGCMPNTQTCNYWNANNCGNPTGGGGGPGGSCTSGGDCFTGISNCGQVGRQTQTGTCSGGICCAFASGGGGCQLEVRQFPSVIHVGETLPWQIFERGGVGHEGFFTYDLRPWGGQNWPNWMTVITPMSQSGTATYTGTIRGVQTGFTKVQFATRIDWLNPVICRLERNITILPPLCTPNCSAACGQADGCGGTCGNTSLGAPATPTNLQPNGNVTPASGQVTVSWTASARATSYEREIYPVGTNCSDPNAQCATGTATSYPFTVGGPSQYTLRVRAVNSACNAITGTATTYSAWASVNFNVVGAITGTFYLDPNGTCNASGLTAVNAGSTVVSGVDRNGNTVSGTATGTTYSINMPYWNPGGNNSVSIQPGVNPGTGRQLYCACNATGSDGLTCQRTGLNSPQANVHFFLTDRLPVESWYQVVNGSIYSALTGSGSIGIRSLVPNLCISPGCVPFVLAQAQPVPATPAPSVPAPLGNILLNEGSGTTFSGGSAAYNGFLGVSPSSDVGLPTWQSSSNCVNGSCLAFNGTNQVATMNSPGIQTPPLTYSAWIRPAAGSTGPRTILANYNANVRPGPLFQVNNGVVSLHSGSQTVAATGTVNDGNWHHVAAVVTPTTTTIYVDGVARGTGPYTWVANSIDNLRIGARLLSNSPTAYFQGSIDQIRIFNYALTPEQISVEAGTFVGTPSGPAPNADAAGIGVTGGSAIDTETTPGNSRAKLTQRATTTTAAIGTTTAKREDYGYFARLYDIASTDATTYNDFDGSPGRSAAGNATKPTLAPRSGKGAYITSGDLTISQAWSVGSSEKIVVFVPGNLYINDPSSLRTLTTVAQGGFLAFIVQGNIVINSNLGYPAPYTQTTPNITGVFISDGTLSTGTGNLKLIGAGNFIGWGGVSLQRDLGLITGYNETNPAEAFIARPDLVKNIPIQMTSSSSTWQEVN